MHVLHLLATLFLPRLAANLFPDMDEGDSVDFFEPEVARFRVVQPPIFPNISPQPRIENEEYVVPEMEPLPTTEPTEPEKPDNSYAINYCDRNEFPDNVLASYNLERVDYFIYNTSCSHIFFQCSIGQTFFLQCSSPDQAFDRSTTNCNFKSDVKYCAEYDHITHCTIQETCTENEFACCSMPQMCVHLSKRCDGHPDCADGDDENNCPSCARNEFACVKSGKCIEASQRCDNVADDCKDGSNLDEIGCSRNTTCVGKFMCGHSHGGSTCIEWNLHCDGKSDCLMGEDETNCRQEERSKYLLCENQKQSVTKNQWCDGEKHCADGSDEKYCR